MSGDPEQEYFADGMADEILTALSRFRELFVIARTSSFTYKGKAVDVRQIGRELGVRYVLEGSVRKAGGRVRITGQLIDATTVSRFILVGHEPNLTAGMLELTKMHADSEIELKKGGCYAIRMTETGETHLEWMLAPKVMRAAG